MKIRCGGCFEMFDNEFEVCPHCGYYNSAQPIEPYQLPAGTRLSNGRYVLGSVIGFGGFGITYKAWDNVLDNVVAIKEYYPSGIVNRVNGSSNVMLFEKKKKDFHFGLERFILEAQSMAKFNSHSNIVNVYTYLEENNTAYIVMEFLDGQTLEEEMKVSSSKLSIDRGIYITLKVCNALRDIHNSGVIHRDISPDNIFICKDGAIKLIDFGAARFSEKADRNYTIILKPGFAPPEQYEQISEQGAWTDIYAVGATLYYMITGEKPEESTNRKIKDNLLEPIEICPEIPKYLSDGILKAMAIEKHLRFSSIDEFVAVINEEKKVDSPKVERKKKKIKRFVGIFALVLALTGIGFLFGTNLKKQDETVRLEPADITVWYIDNGNDEQKRAYEFIVNEFTKAYEGVTIELVPQKQDSYNELLDKALASSDKPNVFISDDVSTDQLSNAVDLTTIAYPENINSIYFLLSSLKKTGKNDCYFLNNYSAYFPQAKQMPTAFSVPVFYVNTRISDFDMTEVTELSDILSYASNDKPIIVDEKMTTVFEDTFGAVNNIKIRVGTVEDFTSGNASFFFSESSEYDSVKTLVFDSQKKVTGTLGIVSIAKKGLLCSWHTVWSVGNTGNQDEIDASLRFVDYLLSSATQFRLFNSYSAEKPLALNAEALSKYLVNSDKFAFVEDNIDNYVFEAK